MDTNYKMTTDVVRLNFVHLFEKFSPIKGAEERYSAQLIMMKGQKDMLKQMSGIIKLIKEEHKHTTFRGNTDGLFIPIKDGDKTKIGMEAYKDCYYVDVKSKFRPRMAKDENGIYSEIIDPDEIQNGCYAKAVIYFYPYFTGANKGIGCGISNLVKVRNGAPIIELPSFESIFGPPQSMVTTPYSGGTSNSSNSSYSDYSSEEEENEEDISTGELPF